MLTGSALLLLSHFFRFFSEHQTFRRGEMSRGKVNVDVGFTTSLVKTEKLENYWID